MTVYVYTAKPLLSYPVTSTFEQHRQRKPHPSPSPGLDLALPDRTPVPSPCGGKVLRWYWSETGGRILVLDDLMGHLWFLMHCSYSLVAVGEKIVKGQVVALSGNTGSASTGPHLHISLKVNGQWVDPMLMLE